MLILGVVAFLSTTAFYRQALRSGMHPGKAASIPFFAFGIFLIIEYLIAEIIVDLALALELSNNTIQWIILPMYLFFVLAYIALIRRNWLVLVLAAKTLASAAQLSKKEDKH